MLVVPDKTLMVTVVVLSAQKNVTTILTGILPHGVISLCWLLTMTVAITSAPTLKMFVSTVNAAQEQLMPFKVKLLNYKLKAVGTTTKLNAWVETTLGWNTDLDTKSLTTKWDQLLSVL